MEGVIKTYLAPTSIIDSDHPAVRAHAADAIRGAEDNSVAKAVRLYYAVRDGIWYDPYLPFYKPEHYRASHVLHAGRAFCVGKATLLCALGRACGIPSRVGFADVPVQRLVAAWEEAYGKDRVGRWVRGFEASGGRSIKQFEREDVVDI
jgi:transglutaminase-like putative cysteine protease